MGKNEKAPKITINGKEYGEADLTQEQIILVNHCMDLERKISQAQFNLDQLAVGRQAFMARLEVSLKQTENTEDKKNA